MSALDARWYDDDAGPVVRPYALTPGRSPQADESLEPITLITAARGVRLKPGELVPEQLEMMRRCQLPTSVADLTAELDLPLAVVQGLLADLRGRHLISAHHPVPPARLPDQTVLKGVADALRRL